MDGLGAMEVRHEMPCKSVSPACGASSEPGDAGSPPSGGGGIFADAGAYMAMLGPSARNSRHTPDPNPAGTACLSCHGGQKGNVVQFLFAGTAWSSPAETTPTPMAEVRVVQANGWR